VKGHYCYYSMDESVRLQRRSADFAKLNTITTDLSSSHTSNINNKCLENCKSFSSWKSPTR